MLSTNFSNLAIWARELKLDTCVHFIIFTNMYVSMPNFNWLVSHVNLKTFFFLLILQLIVFLIFVCSGSSYATGKSWPTWLKWCSWRGSRLEASSPAYSPTSECPTHYPIDTHYQLTLENSLRIVCSHLFRTFISHILIQ